MTDLKGKTVVFTGFRDDDLKQTIQEKGGRVVSAISGKTDILITSGINSQKAKKAKTLNGKVLVISKEDFIEKHRKKSFMSRLFGL